MRERRMRRVRKVLGCATLVVIGGLIGCEAQSTGLLCPAVEQNALVLTVQDSLTTQPITDFLAWVSDGTRTDTLRVLENTAYGPSRSGVFRVTVEKDGYQAWERPEVAVAAEGCLLHTVSLLVRLQGSN